MWTTNGKALVYLPPTPTVGAQKCQTEIKTIAEQTLTPTNLNIMKKYIVHGETLVGLGHKRLPYVRGSFWGGFCIFECIGAAGFWESLTACTRLIPPSFIQLAMHFLRVFQSVHV